MQHGVIIGCGAMGRCHGEAYKSIENTVITAVVDLDQEKGEALAAQLGCNWARTLDELSQNKIDFVDICLPTHLHLPMIRQASVYTSNIICEKPLAVKEEEVNEIKDLVREKDLHLMVAHVLRFWDTYSGTAEILKKNVLGNINSISCTRRQRRPAWASNNWLTNVSLSGGLIFDLMIHDIDWIVWHMGKPMAVFGNVVYAKDQSPAHAKAQLQYEDCTVDLFASWGMPESISICSTLEIIGTDGMIGCDRTGCITLTDRDGTREVSIDRYNAYKAELEYFVNCCENNLNPSKCDIHEVVDSLAVARALDTSAREHRIIYLRGGIL